MQSSLPYSMPSIPQLQSETGLSGSPLSVAGVELLDLQRQLYYDAAYFTYLDRQLANQRTIASMNRNDGEAAARLAAIQAEADATREKIAVEREQLSVMREQIASENANSAADRALRLQMLDMQLSQDADQFAQDIGLRRDQLDELVRQFDVEQSGYLNGMPTLTRENQEFGQGMALNEVFSNPRNLSQSLLTLGLSNQDAATFLNALPQVQSLTGNAGPSLSSVLAGLTFNPTLPIPGASGASLPNPTNPLAGNRTGIATAPASAYNLNPAATSSPQVQSFLQGVGGGNITTNAQGQRIQPGPSIATRPPLVPYNTGPNTPISQIPAYNPSTAPGGFSVSRTDPNTATNPVVI
ncbi:MAG TPA: hypothetical protein VEI97_17175, partial [bacterium]|nr:hypothetical protein [bacterium]